MRLIAGEARGRRLNVPRGLQVRPSGARLRESAFGILDHRDAISGARVLDLFAGIGALGLEALSRVAAHLTAVEKERDVARVLMENVAHCRFQDRVQVHVEPARAALARMAGNQAPFGLVLVDPPYRQGLIPEALDDLLRFHMLADGGRVLIEHARDETVETPAGYDVELTRRCGDSLLSLLRRTPAAE